MKIKSYTVESTGELPPIEETIRSLIESGGASRAQLAQWQIALGDALFSIVEGYSDIARAREAYQQVKAVREQIAATLKPQPAKETAHGNTAG